MEVSPIYMAGRFLTASIPPRTRMVVALYFLPAAVELETFFLGVFLVISLSYSESGLTSPLRKIISDTLFFPSFSFSFLMIPAFR